MTLQDDYGIVTRNAEMREVYGNRVSHGRTHVDRLPMVTKKPPTPDPRVQAVNPFILPDRGLYVRGYVDGTKNKTPPLPRVTDVETIIGALALHLGYPKRVVIGPWRSREIAHPRQSGMFLARLYTKASLPEIGRRFGRDHSTIAHGIDAAEDRTRAADEDVRTLERQRLETLVSLAGLEPRVLFAKIGVM